MNQLLLAAVMFLGLIMIPFGLPGTWIIAAAALGYQLLVPDSISMFTIVVVFITPTGTSSSKGMAARGDISAS